MLALKILLWAAFAISIVWAFVHPGYESIIAIIIVVGSLLAVRVNAHAQRDKREFEPDKH